MWLVIAERLRLETVSLPARDGFVAMVFAEFATSLAFVTVVATIIPKLGGVTGLSAMTLRDQIDFALRAYPKLLTICVAAYFGLGWIAWKFGLTSLGHLAPHLLHGVDGVAFDQYAVGGRAWSALIAALGLLMAIDRGQGGAADFAALGAALRRRWPSLLLGVLAATLMAIPLATAQQAARLATKAILASDIANTMKNFIFFGFVVGFALLRLAATATILCLCLRWSYRHDA